jgi:hypothetical protein
LTQRITPNAAIANIKKVTYLTDFSETMTLLFLFIGVLFCCVSELTMGPAVISQVRTLADRFRSGGLSRRLVRCLQGIDFVAFGSVAACAVMGAQFSDGAGSCL